MNLLLQCILILIGVVVLATVALVVYQIICDVIFEVNEKLRARNVTVSSTGVKVGVKKRDRERYLDSVQRQFVSAWNKSQTLGYQGSWLFGSKNKNKSDDPKRTPTPSGGVKKNE